MQVHYLEIVTPEVEATCAWLGVSHDAPFSEPVAELGNARTARRSDGGLTGVRAPMHESETPVVRPYWLVSDIAKAVADAESSGGQTIHPPLEIPGHGTFAIVVQGGIQHGFWQL